MKKKWICSIIFLLFLGILTGFFLNFRILGSVTIEAGKVFQAQDFARFSFDKDKLYFAEQALEGSVAGEVGTLRVKVTAWPFSKTVELVITDTTAPSAEAVNVVGRLGQEFEPEDFVQNVWDATKVSVYFEQVPDNRTVGKQEVTVIVADSGGNQTSVRSTLTIVNVKEALTIEAGSRVPEASAFLLREGGAAYAGSIEDIDTSHVGTYEVQVTADGITVAASLVVEDTIPPKVTVEPVSGWVGKEIEPLAFARLIQDATEVTAAYGETADFRSEGEGSATVIFTDEGGNSVEKQVFYTLKKDTVAPEVAVSEIDVVLGGTISYKKAVHYSDNADSKEELELSVDKSAVDIQTLGTYNVTYTVTDKSGNSTTVSGAVHVLKEQPACYDEELVNQKADEVLSQILTEDMTEREKAKAIYRWLRQNIGYISHSEKTEWVRAAYEGLYKRQGDCYVYACTAKVLLTRAGIPNMDIVKLTVNPSHYWNLVDVGEGWYHFDATPRKDKSVFFLVTDEELKEYSQAHKNSHAYDESLYPEIN